MISYDSAKVAKVEHINQQDQNCFFLAAILVWVMLLNQVELGLFYVYFRCIYSRHSLGLQKSSSHSTPRKNNNIISISVETRCRFLLFFMFFSPFAGSLAAALADAGILGTTGLAGVIFYIIYSQPDKLQW